MSGSLLVSNPSSQRARFYLARWLLLAPFLPCLLWWVAATAAEDGPAQPVRKEFGLDKRVPWTSSRVHGSPDPEPPYRTEPVFPKLKFFEPLDMTRVPDGKRLGIAERKGKLFTFVSGPTVEKADLLLNLNTTVYGLAFHPKFTQNGYFYVVYLPQPDRETPTGTRLARFTAKGNPPVAERSSEKLIFEWPSGGHNGGCLQFGPDGYLYIGTGDGSGIADELQIGQDLSSVLGRILRIDVDQPAPGKGYGIPKDNPFVKQKGARPEIYAYGLRQPWKFTFDRATGALWCGEVGQDLWEMVYRIDKGGNYGWSVQEGKHPFRPERKKGPSPILPPVIEHHHADFRSLTGGYVYHGQRLPELAGQYLYGDFDTGRIWAFQYAQGKAKNHRELAVTRLRIVSWGEDHDGEVYLVDFMGGGLHRLVKAAPVRVTTAFPRKLSETGLFASTKDNRPAPGLIPYSVNAQLWGDHTHKERFIALPGLAQIGFDEITYPQPSPGAPPGWRFPDGTVLVKTFLMDMESGNPKSRKRLETRILHFYQFPGSQEVGDQYWRGYTYVWNEDQTDAELLGAQGLDRELTIKDAAAPGGVRKQLYRFPSRAECTLCHTNAAKFALGVSTLQMNRDHNYGGVVANQLRTLEHLGVFSKPLPKKPANLPQLTDFNDEQQPLARRAVSYLHANCGHCHIKWGGGNAEFKLLATLPVKDMGIVNVPPAHGAFGLQEPRLLAPGAPERSLIYHRMAMTGLGRMPHIGSRVVDEKATRLIHDWIKSMGQQ